jgi:hypothetical protein
MVKWAMVLGVVPPIVLGLSLGLRVAYLRILEGVPGVQICFVTPRVFRPLVLNVFGLCWAVLWQIDNANLQGFWVEAWFGG